MAIAEPNNDSWLDNKRYLFISHYANMWQFVLFIEVLALHIGDTFWLWTMHNVCTFIKHMQPSLRSGSARLHAASVGENSLLALLFNAMLISNHNHFVHPPGNQCNLLCNKINTRADITCINFFLYIWLIKNLKGFVEQIVTRSDRCCWCLRAGSYLKGCFFHSCTAVLLAIYPGKDFNR